MRAMELRRDEYVLAEPSITYPGVRMGDAAEKPEAKNEEGKLHRGHPNDQPHSDQPHIGDGVFKNMRPVIRPEGQLLFGVAQRVDPIPPANPVRKAVTPIVGKIQDCEISDENDRGPRSEDWDQHRERRRRDGVGMQKSIHALPQPIEFKVRYEREQDDADEKRISYVSGDGIALGPTG